MEKQDEIKVIAYRMWEEEGRPYGKDLEHYYRAKQFTSNCSVSQPGPPTYQRRMVAVKKPKRMNVMANGRVIVAVGESTIIGTEERNEVDLNLPRPN